MDNIMPPRQSLATGFRNVDTSGDSDACSRCLDLITGIPFFYDAKRDSIRIVAESRARRVLDAGCGVGVDLAALAAELPPPGRIFGLDASGSLLARARERNAGTVDRGRLVKGDILHAPFRDGAFGACRIDRVLQHIPRPAEAIGELIRVLVPGGTFVAFDNDWDTFSISLDNRDTARRISTFWRDSFASGMIGRDIAHIMGDCDMADIHVEKRTLMLDELETATQLFDLFHLLDRMGLVGVLEPDEIPGIWEELRRRAQEGTFVSGYTAYLVSGTKGTRE